MKAHSLRKSLWWGSALMGAVVVGVVGWYVKSVHGEVSEISARNPRQFTAKAQEKVDTFKRMLGQQQSDEVLRSPVSQDTLFSTIILKDNLRMEPPHFPFTGPPPSGVYPKPPAEVKEQDLPTGLAAVGTVSQVWYTPPRGGVITFKFKTGGKKDKYLFSPGDWIIRDKNDTKSMRLEGIELGEDGGYTLVVDLYKDPNGEPVGQDRGTRWRWDAQPDDEGPIRTNLPANAGPRPGAGAVVAPSETRGGVVETEIGTAETTPPAGVNAGTEGVAGEGNEGTAEAGEAGSEGAEVISAEDRAREAAAAEESEYVALDPSKITVDQMKPEFIEDENDPSRSDVRVDQATYDYFRARDPRKILEDVQTQPATDRNGNKIGIRITNPGGTPLEAFRIRRGDVIVAINGQRVRSRADIMAVAEALPESTTSVSVTIRNTLGREKTMNVDLTDPKTRRNIARYGNTESGN